METQDVDMELNCIICNTFEGVETRHLIFETNTSHSGSLIKDLLHKLLGKSFPETNTESYVCGSCFTLLEQFDYSNILLTDVKKQIQSRMHFSIPDCVAQFVEVACQTEHFLNETWNSIKLEEEADLSKENYCETCNKNFKSGEDLQKHLKTHDAKPYACLHCKHSCDTKWALNRHIKQKHENLKEEKNDLDLEVLPVKVEITESESQNNQSDTDFFQDGPDFFDDIKFEDEIKSESKTKKTRPKRKIKKESYVETDDEKPLSHYQIKSEDSQNKQNGTKRKKMGRKKQDPDDFITILPFKFQCPECPKQWRTKSQLKMHVATHSTLRAHVCEICGKGYRKRSALNHHVAIHQGLNPYTCNICNKVFTEKSGLDKHLNIHTGKADYQCDLCGKRFIHHSSFSVHNLSHSGIKAFKCKTCGRGFISTSHLKRHNRTHSGEKKYGCVHCGRQFAEKYNLNAHIRKNHGLQPNDSQQLPIQSVQVMTLGSL